MGKPFIKKLCTLLNYFLLAGVFLICASCNNEPDRDLRFAYFGDIHYRIAEIQTTDVLVQSVSGELNTLEPGPEFIIQTGDFFHGNKGTDIESEAALTFGHFGRDMKLPFFTAKGNHDTRVPYEKNALPLYSKELGREIDKTYYSFNKANCHFIFLDCTDENLGEQISWLGEDLKNTDSDPAIEHIFVAGHYPLWIVARAGFTRPEYAAQVAPLLAKYNVDAYFCGHTHNKTVTVRMIDGKPLTQIMDAAVVEKGRLAMLAPFLNHVSGQAQGRTDPSLLPLEEGHQIFIPESQLEYYWGYQEGSSTSYYVITVEGKSVTADWFVKGEGIVRSFKWDKPGRLIDLKTPESEERGLLEENDLNQISKAWLYCAPWIKKDSLQAPFSINGVQAGNIKISSAELASYSFWNKLELPLSEAAVKAIRMDNEISILNPTKVRFGLAHIYLLVQFKDGRFAKSSISQKVLTSFDPEEGELTNFPDAELIESVNTGDPLKKVTLSFDRFY